MLQIISGLIFQTFLKRRNIKHVFVTALVVACFHQSCLNYGFTELILSDRRDNLILANKEGLFSLPGYVVIYLVFVGIGGHVYKERCFESVDNHWQLFKECSVISLLAMFLTFIATYVIEGVSRRTANALYISFIVSFVTFLMAIESMSQLLVQFLTMVSKKEARSQLFDAITFNALPFFLAGNLLTGLINFLFTTSEQNDFVAMSLLILYSFALSTIAFLSYVRKWKLLKIFTTPSKEKQ